MSDPTVPQEFLNLPFGSIKNDFTDAINAANTVVQFLDKYSWLVPPQYKPLVDELARLLDGFNHLLGKTP